MHILTSLLLASALASNPEIEYSGRIDFSNPDAPRFSYSGVSIRANVDAAEIGVVLDDERGQNYFAIIIDKVYTGKLQTTAGKKTYTIAQFGKKSVHEVEMVKITEEMFGKVTFYGFDLGSSGQLTPIADKREHLIEFVGNSITCGYGNEGLLGQQFCAETENHYMSYAAITARSLNARPLVASKSGIGIYRNYAGPSEGNEDCMSNFYNRTFLYDAEPKFSFSEQPDLVCINLGTNDFNTPGTDTSKYIERYINLIEQMQSNYRKPEIVCLLGPMLEGETLNLARKCINEVVRRANILANGKVYFFEMTSQQADINGLGTDYHPTVKQHILSARQLTTFISQLKGWPVTPQFLQAKILRNSQIVLYANSPDCLDVLDGISVDVDGKNIAATVSADKSNCSATISLKTDLDKAKVVKISGNAVFNSMMRCVVTK